MARRLIIALTDGLRPDAITPGTMPAMYALGHDYTRATNARTVRPSATVAALASLATGVPPEVHRLTEPGLGFLVGLGTLRPLARELLRAGVPSTVFTTDLTLTQRSITSALASAAGVAELIPLGDRARNVAVAAAERACQGGDGLIMVYLSDCDRAGHAAGWMSAEYLEAAAELDVAISCLARLADVGQLIVLSDHGGGGVRPRDHDDPHPINDHIPLVLAGPAVRRRHLIARPTSLLDVPPTILWHFGLPVPPSYGGSPLEEAFKKPARAGVASG
jgi:hypothetical protein